MSAISTVDVTLGDVTFHLSTSGEPGSLPVLWLHGSGPGVTALTNWHGALESLSRDFYNIAPDVIGFGDSTHPDPPPQGIAAFTTLRVQTLAALLDHLGIDTVDIIGNSMGGIVGLCLALAHSQRVRRIILMGAGGAPLAPTPGLLSLILFYDNPTVEAMRALLPKFVCGGYGGSVFPAMTGPNWISLRCTQSGFESWPNDGAGGARRAESGWGSYAVIASRSFVCRSSCPD